MHRAYLIVTRNKIDEKPQQTISGEQFDIRSWYPYRLRLMPDSDVEPRAFLFPNRSVVGLKVAAE